MMQTFLPYPSYWDSACSLDRARLGKQRVEAYQILIALKEGKGWVHHPATKMWSGYESSLMQYLLCVCDVWASQGHPDNIWTMTVERWPDLQHTLADFNNAPEKPWWWNDDDFHLSHRSNLVRKLATHYGPQFSEPPNDLEYLWPAGGKGFEGQWKISKPGLARIAAGELRDPRGESARIAP